MSSLLRGRAIFLFGAVDNKYCGINQCNVFMCCCDQSLEWDKYLEYIGKLCIKIVMMA